MKDRLRRHIESITNQDLYCTCRILLDSHTFCTWPASLSHHHAYEGGLLAHTVEVCDIALGMSELTANNNLTKPRAKHNVLIAAALWHDFMKTREYVIEDWMGCAAREFPRHLTRNNDSTGWNVWVTSDYQKRIGHIAGSAAEFTRVASAHGVLPETIDAVTHCILSHHGRREWGSPVEPQTIEALILHQADMISAKYGVTKDSL